jgi:hypothetical protein
MPQSIEASLKQEYSFIPFNTIARLFLAGTPFFNYSNLI